MIEVRADNPVPDGDKIVASQPCDVLLLGAGFSRAAGLPSASGLTAHLVAARDALHSRIPLEITEAIDADLEWFAQLQARLRPIAQRLAGVDMDNIEDVFRVTGYDPVEAGSEEAPGALYAGKSYRRLVRMLALVLAYSPRMPTGACFSSPNPYSSLVAQLVSVDGPAGANIAPLTIITTNYDLIFEYAVLADPRLDITYTSRKEYALENVFGREGSTQRTLPYIKLHGSINWFGTGPRLRLDKRVAADFVACEDPLAAIGARYVAAEQDDHAFEMIPPDVLKDIIYREIWNDVWAQAWAALRSCRRIVIIGYSFPSGDVLANDMITFGLANSPYFESVAVLDPEADRVAATLRSRFSGDFSRRLLWSVFNAPFDESVPATLLTYLLGNGYVHISP